MSEANRTGEELSKAYGGIVDKVKTSLSGKLLLIGVIALLCQIPGCMIGVLQSGRAFRAKRVEADISEKWGRQQLVAGPVVAVLIERQVEVYDEKKKTTRLETVVETVQFAPEELTVTGTMTPEIRSRGIFNVLLYRSEITLKGTFAPRWRIPDTAKWTPRFGDAQLLLDIADIKGITAIGVRVAGRPGRVLPLGVQRGSVKHGLCVPMPELADEAVRNGGPIPFEITLSLNGCRSLLFYPVGISNRISLESPWPSPSFTGGFLPQERKVSETGFRAAWSVSDFNRDCPAAWLGARVEFKEESCVGAALVDPVDAYAQVERALSYCLLVCLIVLIALLTAERLGRCWVHPLQYLVAGLSLVLFYMLLLSLSEHIGFGAAYAAAAGVIAALGGFYAKLIFGRWRMAFGLALVTALSYLVVYAILQLEDYALLAGSGVLVLLMAVLMAFTGKLNRKAA